MGAPGDGLPAPGRLPEREGGGGAEALPPEMVGLGTVTLDTIETPTDASRDRPGGSAVYFAAAASLLGRRVGLLGTVGTDYPRQELDVLVSRGVDLAGLAVREGRSFHWHARYGADRVGRETLSSCRGVSAAVIPELPPAWKDPPLLFLGSIDPAVQLAVLESAARPGLVALDSMGHWIRDRPGEVRALAARAHVLFGSQEEVVLLGGRDTLPEAVEALRERGVRCVVVKRGPAGAEAFLGLGSVRCPAYPVRAAVDPTGAGDAFAGGFMGFLAATAPSPTCDCVEGPSASGLGSRVGDDPAFVQAALVHGSALASFAVEAFSIDGFRGASRRVAEGRIRDLEARVRRLRGSPRTGRR